METFAELREAIERAELVDAHAHNIVALDSTLPFLRCFSEATDDQALSSVPHTINFKVFHFIALSILKYVLGSAKFN